MQPLHADRRGIPFLAAFDRPARPARPQNHPHSAISRIAGTSASTALLLPMLFYGDRRQERDPRLVFDDLDERLAATLAMPLGLLRHSALVASLIAWGELVQGVADAASEASGVDRPTSQETVLTGRLIAIADTVRRSFDSRHWQSRGAIPPLRRPPLPERILLRKPEGYLHYALYPETYRVAARRMAWPGAAVIGIRSIRTNLAAMVAASVRRGGCGRRT